MKIFLVFAFFALQFCCIYSQSRFKNEDFLLPRSFNLKDVSISFYRAGCWGTCPAYFVVINGLGEIRYEGIRYVKEIGVRTSQITPQEFVQILQKFYNNNFFDMRAYYNWDVRVELDSNKIQINSSEMACESRKVLTVRLNNHEKSVTDAFKAPSELINLEKLIDSVTFAQKWKN